MLLTHVQLGVHQVPQVLFYNAAFWAVNPQPVLLQDTE